MVTLVVSRTETCDRSRHFLYLVINQRNVLIISSVTTQSSDFLYSSFPLAGGSTWQLAAPERWEGPKAQQLPPQAVLCFAGQSPHILISYITYPPRQFASVATLTYPQTSEYIHISTCFLLIQKYIKLNRLFNLCVCVCLAAVQCYKAVMLLRLLYP